MNTETFSERQNRRRRLVCWAIAIVVLAVGAAKFIFFPSLDPTDHARRDIAALMNALKLYRLDNGRYPTTEQGLRALVEKPTLYPIPLNWRAGGLWSANIRSTEAAT